MIEYGQFCPVAKATEILGERWTLLIVRELLLGTTRFSDLQRALPRASPTILAKRLKELQEAGLLAHSKAAGQSRPEYQLTRSGRALSELIEQLGTWAVRWAPSRLSKSDLDEYFLMLDFSRRLDIEKFPLETGAIGVRFRGPSDKPNWWLLIRDGSTDLCDRDPGFDIDLLISATLLDATKIWLGHESLAHAQRAGKITISGNRALLSTIGKWLGYSAFAEIEKV